MTTQEARLSDHHQALLDRFVAACKTDDHIAAAFLIGSIAKGRADEHSDLDPCVATAEDSCDDFVVAREAFARCLVSHFPSRTLAFQISFS